MTASSWTQEISARTIPEGSEEYATDLSQIYRSWDFSDEPDNKSVRNVSGIWTGNGDLTNIIVSDVTNLGHKSVRNTIPAGAPQSLGGEQYGYWGLGHSFSTRLVEGDTVWIRFFEKFSDNWDWMGNPSNKWMRLRRAAADGGSPPYDEAGHMDMHFGHDSVERNWSRGRAWFSNENILMGPESPSAADGTGSGWTPIPHTSSSDPVRPIHAGFNCFECMVKLQGTFRNDGKVIARYWRDGQYLGEVTPSSAYPVRTLYDVTQTATVMLLHTVWQPYTPNPDAQYSWIADLAVALKLANGTRDDTNHLARDTRGNPFIGLAI